MLMIFQGFAKALSIRRYRCPSCGCVIRLRPLGYFKGHQSPKTLIRETLAARIDSGHWPKSSPSSRARNWLRALKRHALAVLGVTALSDLVIAFDQLVKLGRVPVSRTI